MCRNGLTKFSRAKERAGYSYFFDWTIPEWVAYPTEDGAKDARGELIPVEYFSSKKEMEKFFEKIETFGSNSRTTNQNQLNLGSHD